MFKKENIFIRNKKPFLLKIQSVIDWSLGLSYRKIKQKLEFLYGIKAAISSIHGWVKSFQKKINVCVARKQRNQIAVDGIIIKSRDKLLYLWSAVDLENKELVAFDASVGRSNLDAMLYKIKAKCKGKLPILVADKGPWYKGTMARVGFDRMHNTFSVRNPVEQFFKLVKDRIRVFYNNLNTDDGVKHGSVHEDVYILVQEYKDGDWLNRTVSLTFGSKGFKVFFLYHNHENQSLDYSLGISLNFTRAY